MHVQEFQPISRSFGRFAVMSEHSNPQDWVIKEQVVTDPVSGLTFEFAVSEDGEPHLTVYGDSLVFGNRTIVFHLDGQAATGETAIPRRCRTSAEGLSGLAFPVRNGARR
jgi:hypothetical protein